MTRPVSVCLPSSPSVVCESDVWSLVLVVLAHDFDILSGKTKVDIPLVLEGEYQIVCESRRSLASRTIHLILF